MRYRVFGHTTVNVVVEVEADNEEAAYSAAKEQRSGLTAYAGNGGDDMLVGVEKDGESVSADGDIEYDDIEIIGGG